MTDRVIRFVASAAAAGPPVPGTEWVVVDTSWTPAPGDRPDVRPARPLIVEVLRVDDHLGQATELLDDWADRSGVTERLMVDGVSFWYRRRLVIWRGLLDRMIWRRVVGLLAAEGEIDELELVADLPELRDVGLLLAAEGWSFVVPPPPTAPVAVPRHRLPWPIDPILWRLGLHPAQRGRPAGPSGATVAARSAAVLERARALGREGGRLLVLTAPTTHQTVTSNGGTARQDPFLGPVVDALRGTQLEPILLEVGSGFADDPGWAAFRAHGRERVLPGSLIGRAFDEPGDDAALEDARRSVEARVAEPFARLDVDGLDVAPWIVAGLRDHLARGLLAEMRQALRIRRFLALLRPSAVLMINEYSRPDWLAAASREGVAVVAVQHGIIHPRHAGYIVRSRVGLPLATLTHVFGPYEARLLTGRSVYRPDEVAVSGAPRLELVGSGPASPGERARIRSALGIADGERMLVFSSTNSVPVRATLVAAALDTLLDRPWPGVHLVVKLHPAEDEGSFYPDLVAGLARARGFSAPPLTMIKAIDLFALLRSADAHLGLYSTVLTDAVAAGTPNLIVTSLAGADLIGYVDAGVARPIRNGADLLAALATPEDPATTAAARAAFLADHFAPGPSARRIADDLLARHAGAAGPAGPAGGATPPEP